MGNETDNHTIVEIVDGVLRIRLNPLYTPLPIETLLRQIMEHDG